MNYNKIIGSNIRYERQKRGLTIDELSTCIGIGAGFLGLIERGYRGTSIANLCNIANFFSVTLDQLITKSLADSDAVVNEPSDELASKQLTITSLVKSLDEDELEFLIDVAKSLKRYTKTKGSTSDNDDIVEY